MNFTGRAEIEATLKANRCKHNGEWWTVPRLTFHPEADRIMACFRTLHRADMPTPRLET